MGRSGLHLGTQRIIFLLHPTQPLHRIPAQLRGLPLRLVQDCLRPAVGIQFYTGSAVLHCGISLRLRLQPGCLLPLLLQFCPQPGILFFQLLQLALRLLQAAVGSKALPLQALPLPAQLHDLALGGLQLILELISAPPFLLQLLFQRLPLLCSLLGSGL